MKDGTPVLLRPIKPEDEQLWFDLLARCSADSIYARFRYFFRWSSHEVAARFCYIDYDRELAIVAEVGTGGERQLVGVGRLIADPDHREAEFAVLIADAWQNRGLGGLITDFCTEIARAWGVTRLIAQTTWDNSRVLALFKKRAFRITTSPDAAGVIDISKDLTDAPVGSSR
jgi:acetyltransferase